MAATRCRVSEAFPARVPEAFPAEFRRGKYLGKDGLPENRRLNSFQQHMLGFFFTLRIFNDDVTGDVNDCVNNDVKWWC